MRVRVGPGARGGCYATASPGLQPTKRHDVRLLPAFERYDGPAWRVLRAALRGPRPLAAELDVYALSAEFGLIPAIQPFSDYDRKLDAARASAIRPLVVVALERALGRAALLWGSYQATLICGGQLYQSLIDDPLPKVCGTVTRTSGPIGQQLHQLKVWLEAGG